MTVNIYCIPESSYFQCKLFIINMIYSENSIEYRHGKIPLIALCLADLSSDGTCIYATN